MSASRDHDEQEERLANFRFVHEAQNALAMAWIRVQPTDVLIRSLTDPEDPADYYVCRALSDRQLTYEHRAMVAEQTREALSDHFRGCVRPRRRSKLDRLLLHTASLMTRRDARELAQTQLEHNLAVRRHVAIRVLHRLGLHESDLVAARSAFVNHRDAEAIAILAAYPTGLSGFNCCFLVRAAEACTNPPFSDDSYLGAVALQGLAVGGQLDHEHACTEHPLYYIRAVGRMRDRALAGFLQKSVVAGGVEVLPMAVSVAGRLQLLEMLTDLDAEVFRLVEGDSALYDQL